MKRKISIQVSTLEQDVQIDAWESGEMDVMKMIDGKFSSETFQGLSKEEMLRTIAIQLETLLPMQ